MSGPAAAQGRSGVVRPRPLRWHQRLVADAIYRTLVVASWTIRFQWDVRTRMLQESQQHPVIYCIWHNRLSLCMEVWRKFSRVAGRTHGMAAIVSASQDGGLVARVLERFGVQPVRGSSSRRGPQALLELTTWAEQGYDLAITPDGPRGPRYRVQPGVISLAQVTGLPIVPVSYQLRPKSQLRSWDRFQVPWLFSRCQVVAEAEIKVPREAGAEERESFRRRLEEVMQRITVD